jgi:hypothetical protein
LRRSRRQSVVSEIPPNAAQASSLLSASFSIGAAVGVVVSMRPAPLQAFAHQNNELSKLSENSPHARFLFELRKNLFCFSAPSFQFANFGHGFAFNSLPILRISINKTRPSACALSAQD